jgi:hypothetical protein
MFCKQQKNDPSSMSPGSISARGKAEKRQQPLYAIAGGFGKDRLSNVLA